MFAGETIPVTYRCQNRIMDQMIDLFGTSLKTIPEDSDYFLATIKTTEAGALFLAQQFLDAIQIIDPEYLHEELIRRIKTVR